MGRNLRYLFFDIECCDGKHMCSFGYVVCDEKMKMTAITATVVAADSTIFVVRLMIHLR